MLRIVKGNTLRLAVPTRKITILNGEIASSDAWLPTEIQVYVSNGYQKTLLEHEVEDGKICVRIDNVSVGTYALEVIGKDGDNNVRSCEPCQFQVVNDNREACYPLNNVVSYNLVTVDPVIFVQGPKGEAGEDGQSVYEVVREAGYTGTEAEFINILSALPQIKETVDEIPNYTAGKGISIEDGQISCTLDTDLYIIVDALPDTGLPNKIYLLPSDDDGKTNNKFVEYSYVGGAWEALGESKVEVDLEPYAKKSEVLEQIKELENNIPTVPIKVSDLENDAGYLTEHQSLEGYATTDELNKKANSSDVYTKEETDNKLATKANTADVYTKTEADAKFLTEHQDLSGYALKSEIPTVPTKVSEFTNDAGYLTSHQDISGKADKTEIPTNTSQLTNDSDFATITYINEQIATVKSEEQTLNSLAFYIDVNKASSLGSTRVDVGGNMNMRQLWEDAAVSVLMDANGNYCELNKSDCRYTAEGDYLLNDDGSVIAAYANCDFMKIIPQTYGRVQQVTVGAVTIERLWLSLVPLPGGYIIPQQVVGKFKASEVSGAMRSLPGAVPVASKTINAFWNTAQVRSKNHGLANLDFRNHLLFHMMSKYAYRDAQNTKGSDGTLVWGVGLDGTESTSATDKFTAQRYITTGATLSLGDYDGKMAVTDVNSETCHSVTVAGFENPYGQYWEMVQGLCSVGTDVYHWRANWLPTGTPTAATFTGVDHAILTRPTSIVWGMNIISSAEKQGVYMIPKQAVAGIGYGDNYWYNADGQLWLWGGASYVGASCGLACASSYDAWSSAYANRSARLAFYGDVNKVSSKRLAELAA